DTLRSVCFPVQPRLSPRSSLFPYTTLCRSADAVLPVAPDQVHLWFSEALNSAVSTAAVVNQKNQRIDQHNAFVSLDDATEMDLSDRKSTRLNSSHGSISYAVFCLKKINAER